MVHTRKLIIANLTLLGFKKVVSNYKYTKSGINVYLYTTKAFIIYVPLNKTQRYSNHNVTYSKVITIINRLLNEAHT